MSATSNTVVKETEQIMTQLPPELQQEVRNYARYLLDTKAKPIPRRKPTFDWAGCAKDLRDKYTSVELQHKIADWWVEGATRK